MKKNFTLLLVFSFVLGFSAFAQQFQNGGFEEWEDVGLGAEMLEPVNWSSIKTSDLDNLNLLVPVVWSISDDVHSGEHSVYLLNIETLGIVATGMITNGRVHADLNPDLAYVYTNQEDPRWNSPFAGRPDSVVGWYKCNPAEGDFGTVKVALHVGDLHIPGDEANLVAMAHLELSTVAVTEWTRFAVAFEYYLEVNPDYQLTILYSGNGTEALADSEAWFDDVEFIYNPESVSENKLENLLVYSSYGKINISIKGQDIDEYKIVVNDLMGRHIFNGKLQTGENLQISSGISKGVYIVSAINGSSSYSRKIVIN